MYRLFSPLGGQHGLHTQHHKIGIWMMPYTLDRLDNTCFRGSDVCCSGNFILWSSFWDFLDQGDAHYAPTAASELLRQIELSVANMGERLMQRPDRYSQRLTIKLDYPIGWTSAITGRAASDFVRSHPDALEIFQINRRVRGHRVRLDRQTDLRPPLTHQVTVALELSYLAATQIWEAEIMTIYPGVDIGPLSSASGMIENVVFWDWSAPGDNRFALASLRSASSA